MGATSFPSSTSIACVYWEIWQIWSWKPTVPGRKKTQVVMAGAASGSQEGPPAEGLRGGISHSCGEGHQGSEGTKGAGTVTGSSPQHLMTAGGAPREIEARPQPFSLETSRLLL